MYFQNYSSPTPAPNILDSESFLILRIQLPNTIFSEFPSIIPPSINFLYSYARSPFHNLYLNILFRSKSMNILVQIRMKLYCLRCLVKYECAVSHFIGLPCVYLFFGLPVLIMGLRGVSTCIFFLLLSNKRATPKLLGGEDDSQGMVRMIKRAKVILGFS